MKQLTYIMVITFVLSLTVYSCAKKDENSTSTTTATYTIKGSM